MTQPSPLLVPRAVAATSSSARAELPLDEAEALLATLPGVLSARILAGPAGGIGDVHVLTGGDVLPKQTVRNVESALLARFGVRVDHRKVSVATTSDGAGPRAVRAAAPAPAPAPAPPQDARRLYFEDVEVRRSSRTIWCQVLLRHGAEVVRGEAEAPPGERARVEEIAARATLAALAAAEPGALDLALEGVQVMQAFGRDVVFVGIVARAGRGTTLLTGSCEVRDVGEVAAALAVLDATNRWIARGR